MTTLATLVVLAMIATWVGASSALSGISLAPDTRVRVGTCSATQLESGRLDAGPPGPVEFDRDFAGATINGSTPVSPPSTEVLALGTPPRPLAGGDSIRCVLTIRNRRAGNVTLRLRPLGLLGSRVGGPNVRTIEPSDPEAAATAAGWLEPAVDTLTLAPRELARVPVTVTIPPRPPVGSAYGAIDVVAPRSTAPGADGTAVGFEPHTLAAYLLRVGGTGKPRLRLRDLHAPRLRWNRDPWTLRADLDNDGTLHATPTGRIRIRTIFGGTVTQLDLTDRPLLPGGRVRMERTWDGVPWFGIYRYDVRVAPSGGPDGHPARADGWFVALPPAWVLVLALGAVVLAVAGTAWRRRREQRRTEDDPLDA